MEIESRFIRNSSNNSNNNYVPCYDNDVSSLSSSCSSTSTFDDVEELNERQPLVTILTTTVQRGYEDEPFHVIATHAPTYMPEGILEMIRRIPCNVFPTADVFKAAKLIADFIRQECPLCNCVRLVKIHPEMVYVHVSVVIRNESKQIAILSMNPITGFWVPHMWTAPFLKMMRQRGQ
jgi:hypothetical protein